MLRRKFITLLLIGITVAAVFLLWPKQPTEPTIGSEFLGFTNTSSGLAARFSIVNYPDSAFSPVVVETALRENGGWNPMPKPAGGWPFLQLCVGAQPDVVYTLSVPTTNAPVRLVMEIRTEPTGWRSLGQRLAVAAGRSSGQWHVPLRALYFTNETVVTEAVLSGRASE